MRPLTSVSALLLLCLLSFLAFPLYLSAAPRICCDNAVYTFQVTSGASSVSHTFILKNTGNEKLVFGKVRSCCGTRAVLSSDIVYPDGTASLNVVLSLRGRSGKISKSIHVASNDPESPYLRLMLTGSISSLPPAKHATAKGAVIDPPKAIDHHSNITLKRMDIITVPAEIIISGIHKLSSGAAVSRYVALRSRKHRSFRVTKVDLPGNDLSCVISARGKSGWLIRIDGLRPISELNSSSIVVHTDNTDEPVVSVPVRVIHKGEAGGR